MAENKLLTVPLGNNITDEQLKDAWDAEGRAGIARNEVAYSNRLNTILRQVTLITNAVADLYVEKMNTSVDSNGNSMTSTKLLSLINELVLDLSWNKTDTQVANSVWAGPTSGAKAVPAFRTLVAADIPGLDVAKITSGTFATERIADKAITKAKLNEDVITGKYIVDTLISPKHSSVVGKEGSSETLASYTVRKLTQAQYNAIAVKDPNTLYFIVG